MIGAGPRRSAGSRGGLRRARLLHFPLLLSILSLLLMGPSPAAPAGRPLAFGANGQDALRTAVQSGRVWGGEVAQLPAEAAGRLGGESGSETGEDAAGAGTQVDAAPKGEADPASSPSSPSTEASAWLWIGERRLAYDEVERLLRDLPCRILSVRHNAKSDTASSFYLELESGWEAKFRVVADPRATIRNEDVKREAACYVLARELGGGGGVVRPCILRPLPVERLLPLVSERAAERLRRWARDGQVWGALSPIGGRTVRAQDSYLYGGHYLPESGRRIRRAPAGYFRRLGEMNVLAILSHNGDLHGDNWEVREEDGACFVVDNGLTFTFDGRLPPARLWRRPWHPVAAGIGSSQIERVRRLLSERPRVDQALARLPDGEWGLNPLEREVVFQQARRFLEHWDAQPRVRLSSARFLEGIRTGEFRPFRLRGQRNQPLIEVTDW
jgi:hypothetical protein